MSLCMSAKATPEQRLARALRALLKNIATGGDLPETINLAIVLDMLEHFLPAVLSEVYPYWKGESLDGFFLSTARKIGPDQAELRGVCILISDQAITPFHVQMQLSPSADEVDWMECQLGKRGDGPGGMERIPWARWDGHTDKYAQESLKPVHWAYSVTFGEIRTAI